MRDHTERILNFYKSKDFNVEKYIVPGDISSASFFITLALIKGREMIVRDMGINPGRKGFLKAVKMMGAELEISNIRDFQGEPVCDLIVRKSDLRGAEISAEEIPAMIDEIPCIVIVSLFAEGETIIRNLSELRYKETDRLGNLEENLKRAGASLKVSSNDDLFIGGGAKLKKCDFDSGGDHRLAMAYEILSRALDWKNEIFGRESVKISYPNFYKDLEEAEIE